MRSKLNSAAVIALTLLASMGWAAVPEDILKGAWSDSRVEASRLTVKLAEDAGSYNPIRSSQFKIERGQIDKEDLEFGVRVAPRGIGEISNGIRYRKAMVGRESLKYADTLSQVLSGRYLTMARVVRIQGKLELSKELSAIAQRSGKMLGLTAQKDRAELKGFLKAKSDLQKLELKIAEIKREQLSLERELKAMSLPAPTEFTFTDFASVDDIKSRIDFSRSEESLAARVARSEADVAQTSFSYDRARANQWIDYFELNIKENGRGETVYGLEVAINLPFTAAPIMNDIEKQINTRRDFIDAAFDASAGNQTLLDAIAELKVLFETRENLTRARGLMSAKELKSATRAIGTSDPLLVLELQRNYYEAYEQLIDTEFRIRELYITYLHQTGAIADAPETNHLSKSKKKVI